MATGKRAIIVGYMVRSNLVLPPGFPSIRRTERTKACFVRPGEYGQVSAWRRASDFSRKGYTAMLTTEDHRRQQTE